MIPKNLKKVGEWNAKDILFCVAKDPAHPRIWVGSSDFGVYEFDLRNEKPERVPFEGDGHQSYVTGMVRVGETLVTSSYDRHLVWWDIASKKQIRRVAAHQGWIRRVVASPDATRVFSIGDDMQCKIWDTQSGAAIGSFTDHALMTPHHYPSMLYAIAVSPDGQRVATGDKVGHVAIWDANSLAKVAELETPIMYTWDPRARRHSIGGIRSLAFSPDSRRLAVGGTGTIGNVDHLEGPARLEVFDWAVGTQQFVAEDKNKKGLIEQMVWSPDGKWILTAGGDHNGFMTIYDSEKGELLHQDGQSGHIHGVAHDETFENIFVASHERITRWSMTA